MNAPELEFRTRLASWIARRVRSRVDAEDVLQTVLLRLHEADAGAAPASTPAWLRSVARRAIVDLHRARARAPAGLAQELEPAAPEPEERSELAGCLAPLLAGLDPDERELLERVDVLGASQRELARELGLSESGLKSRVQRARGRLRQALLASCVVERDTQGRPSGAASCRGACAPSASDCADTGCGPSSA